MWIDQNIPRVMSETVFTCKGTCVKEMISLPLAPCFSEGGCPPGLKRKGTVVYKMTLFHNDN